MDLRHLRHFIAVAESGSFSHATDKLCLTQPALTRSIKTLEGEVRAQLLDRQPSGVFLTAAGKTSFAHAKYILNENDRALEQVRLTASGIVNEITVAVCPLQACSLFDSAVDDFNAEHPQVSINLVENHVEETVRLLLDGKVDVVFTTIPETTMQTGLIYERGRRASSSTPLATIDAQPSSSPLSPSPPPSSSGADQRVLNLRRSGGVVRDGDRGIDRQDRAAAVHYAQADHPRYLHHPRLDRAQADRAYVRRFPRNGGTRRDARDAAITTANAMPAAWCSPCGRCCCSRRT